MQERLSLTVDQMRQVEALQKEVDSRLAKILTADQQQQLQALRQGGPGGRGPGNFGPQRGPGGPEGFGPPPGAISETTRR